MIDSLFRELFSSIVKVGIDKWEDNEQFRALRLIAHEKISRELRWNLECLSSSNPRDQSIYIKVLKMDSFMELLAMSVPIDEIFTVKTISFISAGEKPSDRILKIINRDDLLSRLLDRSYNRIGILRLRNSEGLPLGDISYLRNLIKLSLDGVEFARNELRKNSH